MVPQKPDEVIPFDLTAQDRIIRGRMPTLEIIHDRFTRLFRLTASNALRKITDVTVRSTELLKFGEFLKSLSIPSYINIFRMNPLHGNALMIFETRLVFTLIDLFCGGKGKLEVKAEGRDFTEIEQQLMKRVALAALEDLKTAWHPIFPVEPQYQRNEVNPQFVAIVPHSEIVLVVTLEVDLGVKPMIITLCIPYSMIEPIRGTLNAGFHSEHDDRNNAGAKRFEVNFNHVEVDLVAQRTGNPITVQQLIDLKKGQILLSPERIDDPIDILINNKTKYRGSPIEIKGSQGVKIQKVIDIPQGTHDFLEAPVASDTPNTTDSSEKED